MHAKKSRIDIQRYIMHFLDGVFTNNGDVDLMYGFVSKEFCRFYENFLNRNHLLDANALESKFESELKQTGFIYDLKDRSERRRNAFMKLKEMSDRYDTLNSFYTEQINNSLLTDDDRKCLEILLKKIEDCKDFTPETLTDSVESFISTIYERVFVNVNNTIQRILASKIDSQKRSSIHPNPRTQAKLSIPAQPQQPVEHPYIVTRASREKMNKQSIQNPVSETKEQNISAKTQNGKQPNNEDPTKVVRDLFLAVKHECAVFYATPYAHI